ncbi:MAG: GC-type dockerin domain-anchored protein [Phycisphaerales bacterium]
MFRITAVAALAASCGIAAAAPDVVCGSLDDVNYYGTIGDTSAYAVGTTACNKGDVNLNWIDNTPNHPVIQVSIYRLFNGRMEQLGVSFVKHSFASLQGNACGFGCSGGGDFSHLGPGCSDPYGAGLNGSQTDLGPRSEINAWTADFVYPYTSINQSGNAIFKRIQVPRADMQTVGAIYIAEGQYVIKDEFGHFQADGVTPTSYNNVSYKRMSVQASGGATTTGGINREQSAMIAWQEHGLGVNTPDPDVFVATIAVPNEGKLEVGAKVTDLGDGTYRYDYAVHNQNSHMSVGSVSVPNASGTSGHYFHDVDYHDSVDANIDGTDWSPVEDASGISWATESFASNVNANAIRWGTTYNFSFVSDQAPEMGDVTLGMWRDPSVSVTAANIPVPSAGICPADLDGDGVLTFFDISAFLNAFNAQDPIADFDGDGSFTFFDVSGFLNAYNAGCP